MRAPVLHDTVNFIAGHCFYSLKPPLSIHRFLVLSIRCTRMLNTRCRLPSFFRWYNAYSRSRGFAGMGLANQFGGNQAAYQCKNCGHTLALYAPCCPKCLDKTLVQVKTEKSKEGFRREAEASRETPKTGNPVASIAGLAIILGIAAGVYYYFSPPRPESITRTEPPRIVAPIRSVRVSNQSSKRTKRSNPVVSKTRPVPASTPKPTTPMKLWEASSDDEGGDP